MTMTAITPKNKKLKTMQMHRTDALQVKCVLRIEEGAETERETNKVVIDDRDINHNMIRKKEKRR